LTQRPTEDPPVRLVRAVNVLPADPDGTRNAEPSPGEDRGHGVEFSDSKLAFKRVRRNRA